MLIGAMCWAIVGGGYGVSPPFKYRIDISKSKPNTMNKTKLDKHKMSSRTHFSVSLTKAITLFSTPQLGISISPLLYVFTFNMIMLLSTKLMQCLKIIYI